MITHEQYSELHYVLIVTRQYAGWNSIVDNLIIDGFIDSILVSEDPNEGSSFRLKVTFKGLFSLFIYEKTLMLNERLRQKYRVKIYKPI